MNDSKTTAYNADIHAVQPTTPPDTIPGIEHNGRDVDAPAKRFTFLGTKRFWTALIIGQLLSWGLVSNMQWIPCFSISDDSLLLLDMLTCMYASFIGRDQHTDHIHGYTRQQYSSI